MKKYKQNALFRNDSQHNPSLAIHRETVRALNPEDLALVAAGSSTVLTERPTTTTTGGSAC